MNKLLVLASLVACIYGQSHHGEQGHAYSYSTLHQISHPAHQIASASQSQGSSALSHHSLSSRHSQSSSSPILHHVQVAAPAPVQQHIVPALHIPAAPAIHVPVATPAIHIPVAAPAIHHVQTAPVYHVASAPAVHVAAAPAIHVPVKVQTVQKVAPAAVQSGHNIEHYHAESYADFSEHNIPTKQTESYHVSIPKYEFKYGVQDPHTKDYHSQEEKRDGDKVQGYYTLHEADGTMRIVHYTADKHSGFNAVVERKGHATHPGYHGKH